MSEPPKAPGTPAAGSPADGSGSEPEALDFDPYRFGAPEHPVPPEYAPPGYKPPVPAATETPTYPPSTYPPNPYAPGGYPPPNQQGPYPQSPYQQSPYPQSPYPPNPYQQGLSAYPPPGYPGYPPPQYSAYPQPRTGNGRAVAALCLGIGSIVLCFFTLLDLGLIVPAIVLGILARNRAVREPQLGGRGMATAGIVCAVIGAVFATTLMVLLVQAAHYCGPRTVTNTQQTTCIEHHLHLK